MSPLQPVSSDPSSYHHSPAPKRREKLTAASVFLSLLLAVFLVGLGERGIYDLNRLLNPLYSQCQPSKYLIITDRACQVEMFALKTVLFHSYVSVPLFLLFLFITIFLRRRRRQTWQEAIFRVTGVVVFVFGLQLLLEVTFYLFQYHRLIAWYFSFGAGIISAIWLVIHLERRQEAKRLAKHQGGDHHGGADDDDDR